MASARSSGAAAGQLGSLYSLGAAGGLTDGQLLERFLDRDDPAASEAAFSELVDRHGAMVLGVCRRELGDLHDAHDAFQATFLVLVSKAATIRRRESVGGWLLSIARRVATRARLDGDRRRRRLEQLGVERTRRGRTVSAAAMPAEPEPDYTPLIAEVDRLPERFRAPVVLHYFEGLSAEATAQRLGCARGTVLSRLSRARDRIKRRLEQQGVSYPALIPVGDPMVRWLPPAPVPAWLAQRDRPGRQLAGPGRGGDRERGPRRRGQPVASGCPHAGPLAGRRGCVARLPRGGGRLDRPGGDARPGRRAASQGKPWSGRKPRPGNGSLRAPFVR